MTPSDKKEDDFDLDPCYFLRRPLSRSKPRRGTSTVRVGSRVPWPTERACYGGRPASIGVGGAPNGGPFRRSTPSRRQERLHVLKRVGLVGRLVGPPAEDAGEADGDARLVPRRSVEALEGQLK